MKVLAEIGKLIIFIIKFVLVSALVVFIAWFALTIISTFMPDNFAKTVEILKNLFQNA